MLTIKRIIDLCDYVQAVCVANAVIVLITLNELQKPVLVTDIIEHIIHETNGKIILRDQSVRNTLDKLQKLGVIERFPEMKNKKKIYKFSLTKKAIKILTALELFFKEVRNQIKQET